LTRILRATVLLLALLFGSVAAPAAFGATHPATPAASAANSSSLSHTPFAAQALKNAIPASVHTPAAPAATYNCTFYWNPYPYQINWSPCIVYSGYIDIVAYCNDGSSIGSGYFGPVNGVYPGYWYGYVRCGSGINSAYIYTLG
jgi:hypothetical protein